MFYVIKMGWQEEGTTRRVDRALARALAGTIRWWSGSVILPGCFRPAVLRNRGPTSCSLR